MIIAWLTALTILVLYLLWKLASVISWLHAYYNAVNKHFIDCGCAANGSWPPPKPPLFP